MSSGATALAAPIGLEALVLGGAGPSDLEAHLDQLDAEARVRQVLALSGRAQAALYARVEGYSEASLTQLAPEAEVPAPWPLKNSLPLFNRAAKVFLRRDGAEFGIGFNRVGAFAHFFVGPGYFVTTPEDGVLKVDYTRSPDAAPEGWPSLRPNRGRLRGITYGGQIDYLRRVSDDVLIGTAYQNGKHRGAWFVLVRP